MGFYNKQMAFAGFLAAAALSGDVAAFQPSLQQSTQAAAVATSSTTQLAALPPMIISGAFKKMRAEKEKKKMPMVSRDEAKQEAPGLRVGAQVWRWPPVWPYDKEFFMPPEDIPQRKMGVNQMASMLSGIQQVPGVDADEEKEEKEGLDVFQYWGEEKADAKTEMDAEAIENLKK